MTVSAELKQRVIQKLEECIQAAEAHYGYMAFEMPCVRYNVRGTTAGKADLRAWTIELNPVLFRENVEDFLARTVPHEMAHLIDYKLHPENFERRFLGRDRRGRARYSKRDIHGYTWQSIMRVLGADPSRCHSYDTTNAKQRSRKTAKYTWTCKTCARPMELGEQRHRKMLTGQTRYWMRGCGRHAGYTFNGQDAPMARPTVDPVRELERLRRAAQDQEPTITTRVKRTGSNKDKARDAFRQCGDNRGAFISLCESAGIKKTTAGTYWHNFKSGKWS